MITTHNMLLIFSSYGSCANPDVIKIPVQSPDLNPIQHVCDYLRQKKKPNRHDISNKQELRKHMIEERAKIKGSFCAKLISPMPNPRGEVIKFKENNHERTTFGKGGIFGFEKNVSKKIMNKDYSNAVDIHMWHVEFGKERKWNPTGSVKFGIFQNSSLVLRTDRK
ncbi:transposable element Tcb1 transposase [Caerostris darwini]|uniref:Transposable element Tcb1 transposase n=1 Tax=Caerostris darwini TaxID=1538125 RepID=A0AAV4MHJ3_9ARAC|nr:transposable element Tcb1 transposase [Caerostris darwini]